MRVKVKTKHGELFGVVVWSDKDGAYVQFDAFAANHGWYSWILIEKVNYDS